MANRRFQSRTRKRVMSWQGVNIDFSDLVNGVTQFASVITEATLESFPTPTIIRTRGRLALLTDPSSTPGGFGVVSMGLIVVTAAAAAAGAIPNPAAEFGSDWLWWDAVTVGAAAGDVIGEEVTVGRFIVDSKAMRKVGLNQVLVFAASQLTCEGTLVTNLCGAMRFLLKAP